MVRDRASAPPHRTQRALSMNAETRMPHDHFYAASEFHHAQPPFPHAYTYALPHAQPPSPRAPPSPRPPPSPRQPSKDSFHNGNGGLSPRITSQRHRREHPMDAQDQSYPDKLEQHVSKPEQKLSQSEVKQANLAQYDASSQQRLSKEKKPQQRSLPIYPFLSQPTNNNNTYYADNPYPTDPYAYPSQHQYHYYHSSNDGASSSSSSTLSRHSHIQPEPLRSLSLRSTTKSMYDLRPSSSVPPSPALEYRIGYESVENSPTLSRGWDSLMDTLNSPTVSAPTDTSNWDLKEELDLDPTDSNSAVTLSHEIPSNGNGKYLLVLGANGRTGVELVKQGLERNYRVTAFVRDDKLFLQDSSLRKKYNLLIVRGSPTSQADVDSCVEGQDVVVNLIGARLMANDTTIGSHSQVVLNNALKKHNVRRLIVVTSYGCHGLRNHLIQTKMLFSWMLMTGILKDKVLQEDVIQRDSTSLDWTIVRPITLKDGDLSGKYWVSSDDLPKKNKVKMLTRKDLAHYILSIINLPQEFNTIRNIAGKPKSTKQSPVYRLDKRREAQEQARQQDLAKQQELMALGP
ncbi:hypothetical protein BGZ98_009543 [Dissophora globulifera]|nr:hypothetical protein BGZ98_009543 [Dissophora globulifera]